MLCRIGGGRERREGGSRGRGGRRQAKGTEEVREWKKRRGKGRRDEGREVTRCR